jgi:hypothetical protein
MLAAAHRTVTWKNPVTVQSFIFFYPSIYLHYFNMEPTTVCDTQRVFDLSIFKHGNFKTNNQYRNMENKLSNYRYRSSEKVSTTAYRWKITHLRRTHVSHVLPRVCIFSVFWL